MSNAIARIIYAQQNAVSHLCLRLLVRMLPLLPSLERQRMVPVIIDTCVYAVIEAVVQLVSRASRSTSGWRARL